MALTVTTVRSQEVIGRKVLTVADITFDSSYPTGGEALTASDLSLAALDIVLAENAAGYSFEYDYTNSKLVARYFDYNAVADGAAIEVPDTTNLSTLSGVRVLAIGDR